MRVRNLLAATAVSALVIGAVGSPAHSVTAPPPDGAGTLVTWGDEEIADAAAAMTVPDDLTGPVRSVAANPRATGVVTLDGGVRVWGSPVAPEVTEAPTGITDATAITLTTDNGAVLHADGRITAWGGSPALSEVPTDLRAKAIALQVGTGYAVRPDGTLATWGDEPASPVPPSGLTDLVDVSASLTHVLALHADGTVVTWGAGFPASSISPTSAARRSSRSAPALGSAVSSSRTAPSRPLASPPSCRRESRLSMA